MVLHYEMVGGSVSVSDYEAPKTSMTIKVIASVEELAKAIITLSRPVAMDVTELYAALPDAPLPAPVEAAVAWFNDRATPCWASCETDPCPDGGGCLYTAQRTILRALAAATAERERLITGVKGEVYSCKSDIFGATYEAVEEGK